MKRKILKDYKLKANEDICTKGKCNGIMEMLEETPNYKKWVCKECGYVEKVDR